MKQVLEGSHAVSEAVKLARVQVISAYPITPQTHIVEALSEHCAAGTLAARFINVESEHSSMAAAVAAAATGVRTFTATSSHGLALMHEMLHWAAGARLPIVMAEVNRALAPGWNIWMDQSDSLSQRDTGWVQLYCEDGQDVLDTTLQAFALAETVSLPVMVVLDAFFLSHTFEPVDVPDQKTVDRFLPPYQPRIELDPANPFAFGQMAPPGVYMEMRHSMQQAMQCVVRELKNVEKRFAAVFGRACGPVEAVACEDAEIILVLTGTVVATGRLVIEQLRARGEKVGLLKLRLFRPFPGAIIANYVSHCCKIAVLDRNIGFGVGGIFAQELRAALYQHTPRPPVYSYIAGLGGRDVTPQTLEEVYYSTRNTPVPSDQSIWIGLNKELEQDAKSS